MEKTIHHGRNIKRFREMMGIKQDALAAELGDEWDQVKVSRLEAKEEVEEKLLVQLAGVLKVPVRRRLKISMKGRPSALYPTHLRIVLQL